MKGLNLFAIVAIILLLFSVCVILPVSAGMKVTGAKIMDTVSPGDDINYKVTISTNELDPPMDLVVTVAGFGNEISGTYVPLELKNDMGQYSARSFIELDKNSFHLNPGESENIFVTGTIPIDVGDGGRYAIIYISNDAGEGGQLSYSTAIKIPVMLTISNSDIKKTGLISEIIVDEITVGQPVTIRTTFRNTGNHHYYNAWNRVELRDQTGNVIAFVDGEPENHAIIPLNSVVFNVEISDLLDNGAYTATSKVFLEGNTLLDENVTTFEVNEDYVPPFSDCSVIVSPGSPAELATSDGRCRINFPQGAVFGETEVSLNAVMKDELPRANSDVTLGTTCFCVDGLSGLLSKDAKLVVRYSDNDLAVAGGKASLLKLGYYNEAEHQWKVMPTDVNENAMTLTTSTNHFSTWAVLVSSSDESAGSTNSSQGTTPLSPLLGLSALIVVAFAFRMRRER